MQAFVRSSAAATAIGPRPELPAAVAAAEAIGAQNPRGIAQFGRCVAAPAPAVIGELSKIPAPALVIVGEKDEAFLRAAELMVARLSEAQRVTIPRAGHIVKIEEADAFNASAIPLLRAL